MTERQTSKALRYPAILSILVGLVAFAFGVAGHTVVALILAVLAFAAAIALDVAGPEKREWTVSVAMGVANVTIVLAVLHLVGLS